MVTQVGRADRLPPSATQVAEIPFPKLDAKKPNDDRRDIRKVEKTISTLRSQIRQIEDLANSDNESPLGKAININYSKYCSQMLDVLEWQKKPGFMSNPSNKLKVLNMELDTKDNFLNNIAKLSKNSNSPLGNKIKKILDDRVIYTPWGR